MSVGLLHHEEIYTPETNDFTSSRCEVYADHDGYFITVETDSYEGSAMMTLPCAVKVRAALGRAIRVAKRHRKEQG
jgi:hypothetical protein